MMYDIANGDDQAQPALNLKCIVFTFVLVLGYWYLPHRNKWVLLGLLYFPYLALAHYDHWYDCRRNMGPTYLANFYEWAKPQESRQVRQYRAWSPKMKARIAIVDAAVLMVVLLLAPAFLRWRPA